MIQGGSTITRREYTQAPQSIFGAPCVPASGVVSKMLGPSIPLTGGVGC